MAIIAVDFDGTLYEENSAKVTIKAGRTALTFKQWVHIFKDIVKGIANSPGQKKDFNILFLKSFFYQMKGMSREEISDFFTGLVDAGKDGINKELFLRVNKHLEDGNQVVILSGALQPFLEIFVRELSISADVIGTQLFFDEKGICTGKIGALNRGIEKVNRLQRWIEEKGVEGERIWAYADSESDIPILEFADKAVAVNPSNKLKEIAELNKWEIF
ncbi:MAG: HAD-IB family phosphatase [Tissierellaceae bacterium]|nr:HAD-IB family phosphatase [Tissierellaceae bacterium]